MRKGLRYISRRETAWPRREPVKTVMRFFKKPPMANPPAGRDDRENFEEKYKKKHAPHYYGDEMRKLFIVNGAIMLISLPFFRNEIQVPIIVSVASIIILVFMAGIISPVQKKWMFFLQSVIAGVGFVIFEYYALQTNTSTDFSLSFFLVNQIIAIVFFVALYFSTKTLRGAIEKENGK